MPIAAAFSLELRMNAPFPKDAGYFASTPKAEAASPVTCPFCRQLCEIVKIVVPDPECPLTIAFHLDHPTVYATCRECTAEFQLTKVGK